MQLFVRIVELGNFTRAAEQLDIPRASATALIRQLEQHLDTGLLQRTTRRVSPTPDGETYYRYCVTILAELEAAESALSQSARHPRGRLKVDLPPSLGRLVVIPALPDFYRRYPDIMLEISVADRIVDLIQEGVDCVLRIGSLPDSTLKARPLASLSQVTCASPDYIARRGVPRSPDALDGHCCIEFLSATTGRVDPLWFTVDGQPQSRRLPASLAVNNGTSYVAACEAGLGIAQAPRYHVAPQLEQGTLIELLPEFRPPALALNLLYSGQRQVPPRLRVFIDWLVELFRED